MYLLRGTTLSCGCYGREQYAASGRARRKGAVVSYQAVHAALRYKRGPARDHQCADCSGRADEWSLCGRPGERHIGLTDRGYPVAYSTLLGDYEPRCRRCHRLHDLRIKGVS
jgi:choline dehydrogenase-like flavoprotein